MFELISYLFLEWVRLIDFSLGFIPEQYWALTGILYALLAGLLPVVFVIGSVALIWTGRLPLIGTKFQWFNRTVNFFTWAIVTSVFLTVVPSAVINSSLAAGIQNFTWTVNVPNPLEYLAPVYRQGAQLAQDVGLDVEVPAEPETEPATDFVNEIKVPLRFDRRADGSIFAVYVDSGRFVYEQIEAPRTPESLVEDLGLAIRQQLLQLDATNETRFDRAWVNLGREVIALWDSDEILAAAQTGTYAEVQSLVDRHRQSYDIAETVEGVPPVLNGWRGDPVEMDQARRAYGALANRYIQAEIAVQNARSLDETEVAERVDELRANQGLLLAELATLREWAEEAAISCEGLDKIDGPDERERRTRFCTTRTEILKIEAKIEAHLDETGAVEPAHKESSSAWVGVALLIAAIVLTLAFLGFAGIFYRTELKRLWGWYQNYSQRKRRQRQNRQRQQQRRQRQAQQTPAAPAPQPAQPAAPAQPQGGQQQTPPTNPPAGGGGGQNP